MSSRAASSLSDALHHYFGFQEFRPLQREAIEAALQSKDVLIVMPTGAGKSLCFQLPALFGTGLTLVISPLVALMRDQVMALRKSPAIRQVGVAALSSLQSAEEQSTTLQELRGGHLRLLYVSPERFRSAAFRDALKSVPLARFVVDEAHCISEWGHDFRPDYLQLKEVVKNLGSPPLIAVTATATPRVQENIIANLGMRQPRTIIGGFNRPNLHYSVHSCQNDAHKQEKLTRALPKLCARGGSGLIYAGTRKGCEEVAALASRALAPQGIRAAAYHAGLSADRRLELQHAWQQGEIAVLCATNAFGMGIDKPDVRFVVHYVHPESLESYYQEAGRAGRDGRPARCVVLYHFADRRLREWFIENDSVTGSDVRTALARICHESSTDTAIINLESWQENFKWSFVKTRLTIGHLERAGLVEHAGETTDQWILRVLQRQFPPGDFARMDDMLRLQKRERVRRLRQMVDYCRTHQCRRTTMLDYFGDTTENAPKSTFCCDNCADPKPAPVSAAARAHIPMPSDVDGADIYAVLKGIDALRPAVGRTRLNMLLRGSNSKEVERFREQRCPLLGIFDGASRAAVDGFLDGLIQEELLQQGGEEEFFVCDITAQGRKTWQEKLPVNVLLPRQLKRETSGGATQMDDHSELYESLRRWRWEQAKTENAAPFMVLSNRSLQEIAHYQPQSAAALSQIHGIGTVKMEKYGKVLLDLVQLETQNGSGTP